MIHEQVPRAGMDGKRRGRLAFGLGGVAISAFYLPVAWGYGIGTRAQPGPGLFPVIAGAVLLLLSVGVCVEAWSRTRSIAIAGRLELPSGEGLRKILGTVGGLVAYMVLAPFLGSYIAASIFMTIAVKFTTTFSWLRCTVQGVLLAVLICGFFREILAVRLSTGLFGF